MVKSWFLTRTCMSRCSNYTFINMQYINYAVRNKNYSKCSKKTTVKFINFVNLMFGQMNVFWRYFIVLIGLANIWPSSSSLTLLFSLSLSQMANQPKIQQSLQGHKVCVCSSTKYKVGRCRWDDRNFANSNQNFPFFLLLLSTSTHRKRRKKSEKAFFESWLQEGREKQANFRIFRPYLDLPDSVLSSLKYIINSDQTIMWLITWFCQIYDKNEPLTNWYRF